MHDYGIPQESVRLALALGILISMLVYERWRLTGGAAVVAGYLAIFMNRPLYILTTVAVAVATFWLVQKYVAPRMFLYGRRRLVVMVLVGMGLQFVTGLAAFYSVIEIPWLAGLFGVGFVLPGLIAQDMERQGVPQTILTVVGTGVLTFLILTILLGIKNMLPLAGTAVPMTIETLHYAYHTRLLLPAVVFSILISAWLFEKFGIRSGGFLTAAYLALFAFQPQHLLVIGVLGGLVYFVVTHLLMHWASLFGRTKFATMVLTALILTWLAELLLAGSTGQAFILFAGFSIISPMIVALIANDGERQGLPKTLLGVTASTGLVFVVIQVLDYMLYSL